MSGIGKDFVEAMEKFAIYGQLAIAGMTALDVGMQTKDRTDMVKLKSPIPANAGQVNQFNLKGSNQYQFEGGKHTNLKPVISPHTSLY